MDLSTINLSLFDTLYKAYEKALTTKDHIKIKAAAHAMLTRIGPNAVMELANAGRQTLAPANDKVTSNATPSPEPVSKSS